jgi:hypothetical protein
VYSGAAELSVGLNQAPQDLDLDIERMIHTSVTTDSVDDVLTIGDWTDTGSLSYQLYLSEGNHSVYAVNDAEDKVYLALHTVNASSHSIAIVTGNAHVLSGALTYDGGPKSVAATITAVSATGAEHSVTASASMYSMRLPAGTYAITAQYSGLDDGSYYRYTAFDNITISASEVLNLQYGRAYANSTVNITVSNYDAEENQTTLQFHANDATAMDATLTLVDNGSVSLAPGEYTVYAFNSGDRAYLGTFSVALDQDSDLHVGLQEAYALSGVTRASSLPVSATMTVQQGDSIIELQSDIDGRFSLILPAGYYEIASSAIVSENGVSVQYVGSFAKSLHQTADDVYDMLRHDQRRIALVASGPVDVDPGQSYVFNLNVANTGNTLETVTLSSNGWTMVFTQNELIMDYGSAASSQSLQFTLQVPSNAVVGQQVKVLASAADGTPLGSYTLDLNVSAHAGVDLAFAQAQGTDGSSYRYAVYVNNTGNAAGSYTLDLNAAALAASGWQASLVDSGGTAVSQVTVVAYSSQTVYVKLTPQGEIQTPPLVTIAVSGDEQDSLTFTAPLPEMSVGGEVSVSGPDVYSDGGEVPLSTWFMLGASILAIMLFLMMGITRGVFSRRKR